MSNIISLQDLNLNELITSKNCIIKNVSYSRDEYLDAISQIQMHSYKDPRIEWGIRWRQILANSIPFILKLIAKGYNDFHVFPISSKRSSWITYSEDEFIKYNRSFGIPLEVYHFGVSYQKKNREWVKMTQLFQSIYHEGSHSSIGRYIENLEKVGALAKVCNSYQDIENKYLYSSKYIISKEKCRELVSLFISTFFTTITHISLSSSLSSLSSIPTSSLSSVSLLGTAKGANCIKKYTFDTLIEENNRVLPEEEQLIYRGRRMYSEVCSYWNEEKHDVIPAGQMTKQRYCDKVFGQNNWFEFDRRGSIYNITYSLNKKAFLSNDIDIYENINNKKFASKEERDLYKLTQMNVYFSNVRRTIGFFQRYLEQKANGVAVPENKMKLIEAWWKLCGGENITWNEFLNNFRKLYNKRKASMRKFIGSEKKYIDSKSKYSIGYEQNNTDFIFMYESEIYLKFVTELREQGIRVIQIYDGFYLKKGSTTEKELSDLLEKITLEYVKE